MINPHRIDFASLSLFNLVARTGSISKGAALAHLAVGAASKQFPIWRWRSAPHCWSGTRAG